MKKIIPLSIVLFLIVSCAMLDKIPPVLEASLSKISEVAGESFILNVSATDQSGIDRIEIYANDNLILKTTQTGQISIPAPYGSFTFRVVAYDRAGNSSAKVIGPFRTKDLTKPKVAIDYTPKGVQPGEMVTAIVSAQDNESGIRVIGLKINKKEVQLTNNRYTFQAQAGTYELEAYAVDNEGNDNVAKITLNVSTAGDTSGPEIDFPNLPKKARPGTNVNIAITAVDESGVSKIIFNDGKETIYVPTMPATQLVWSITRNVGTTNPYSFTVTAYDSRNNYATKTGSIEIGANLPPSVSIEVDKPTPKEGDKVKISVNATDDSKVTQVVLYIDNIPVRTFTQQPYVYEWTAVKGIHKIKVIATDDSNESTEAFYSINVGVIDTEAPIIYFTSPYGIPVNEAYTFYVFVTDNVQVNEVTFTFTGPVQKGPILASTIGGGVFTVTETFTTKGNYEVIVVAKDSSGNSSSQKGQFPVDEAYIVKAPKIKEFSYSPSVLNQGEKVHFKVIAQDDLSLSRCDFYVNGVKRSSTNPSVNIFEWDWSATTLGVHDIRVVVVDTEGFTAEATGTVIVTTERPITKILQPEDGFRTPFADNMSLSLNAQVVDTNNPSTAYFDVKGPVDEKIPVTASGDGPVYTFSAKWKVQTYGEYQIDFYYKNDINLSDATSVSVNILDLGVVFEEPLPGQQHQCGYDLIVRAKVSVYLTESEKFEISYASRKLELFVPNPTVTTSTYNIYQTTIPSTFFTEPGVYTLTFSGKTTAGEEGIGKTTVNVIDSQPPVITQARINSQDIVEGGIYNVAMSSVPTVSITASDNRQVASIQLQKKISGIYTNLSTSNSNTLTYNVQNLDSFENYFRIVVTDLDSNQTIRNFVIYAYEQTPPQISGFRSMQLYPSADVYDMYAQLLIQIRGSLNNNTQFKVTDDTGIKEVRVRIVDSEANGELYEQSIKKLYEYITGNILKELYINNQDIPMYTPSQVGTYKINLEAVDVFGNTNLIAQQEINVEDLTPPIVNLDIPQGKYYGTNSEGKKIIRTVSDVKVSFLDNTEPIYKVELWIVDPSGKTEKIGEKSDLATNSWTFENISLTSYSDGITRFRAIAITTSGATGEGELAVVIDNKTNPAVTIQLPPALTFGSRQVYRGLLTVTAQIANTDVPYDIQKVELYVDNTKRLEIRSPVQENGELKFQFLLETTSYTNGNHTIALKVYDHAENSSQLTDSRCFANVIFDNSAPVLLSDSDRIYTNQPTITLQVDESYGIQETFLIVENNAINPQPGTLTFVHGLSENTSKPFSLYIKDTAGNIANYSGTLYYDTQKPVITIQNVNPTGIATETGAVFTLSFSDNLTSVSTLNIYENSTLKESFSLSWGQTNKTWTYIPPINYEGQKTFKFEIYDRAGNLSDPKQQTIDIDTFAPRINSFNCDITKYIDGIYYTISGTSNVTWSVTDNYFDKVTLEKGQTIWYLMDHNGNYNVGLDLGLNVVKLTAYDQAKHKTEQTIRIIRDNQEPQISNVKIANINVTENATTTITGTGNKTLTFSVSELYIDWDESSIYINDSGVYSGNDWNKTGTNPNYNITTSLNISGDTKIDIILKDYAGNERKFTFYIEVQQ